MASRPTFTISGSQVTICIPPDWSTNISAISRKPYHQLMSINSSVDRLVTGSFVSDSNVAMNDALHGPRYLTFPIKPHDTTIDVVLAFYYSETQPKRGTNIENSDYASSKVKVFESSKMADLSPEIPDYCTYFVFVEDAPEEQQLPGSGQYDDLVATIYLLKTNPYPIPPPPRPSRIEDYLRIYDTAFLIDDSVSMKRDCKWTELNNALLGFSSTAISLDANGIDLFFLNSDNKFFFKDEIRGVQDEHKVRQALSKVRPDGHYTPTGKRVLERMQEFLARLDSAVRTSYSQIKPLHLIVITDGCPNDEDPDLELGKVLVEMSAKFREHNHHPNWMGIQFVQIGDDPGAWEALRKLAYLDTGGMVHTVPYDGPGSITPDKMQRILLGGLRAQNA